AEIQRMLGGVHGGICDTVGQMRAAVGGLADAASQTALTPLLDSLDLLLKAEPTTIPTEVLETLAELAQRLISTAAEQKDVAPLLNDMISGEFTPATGNAGAVYAAWREALAHPLRKARDAMPRITIPVVVVAMTGAEAKALASGEAFASWPAPFRQEFDEVAPRLGDWVARYGATAEEWRPFADNRKTVAELIRDAFALVEGCRAPLHPSF